MPSVLHVYGVPEEQLGLKATAPDSPLSSVLQALHETQRKADTAYRKGEDMRREVRELAERLDELHIPEQVTGADPELDRKVQELSKWKAKAAQRMTHVLEFANDAVAAIERVEANVSANHKALTTNFLRQAEELRELKATVAGLQRKMKVKQNDN